jgi:hypothetical protein
VKQHICRTCEETYRVSTHPDENSRSWYCSKKCGTHSCSECGDPFLPLVRRGPSQRACSPQCQEARDRRLSRERVAKTRSSTRSHTSCLRCGKQLTGRRDSKFCSAICREVHHRRRLPEPLADRMCALPECGKQFKPRRSLQRCCCEKHGKLLNGREGRAFGRHAPTVWNDKRRDAYHRRRALKKAGTVGRPVVNSEIYERDGWRCGVCGKRVDKKLRWPHPKSATLDHVVPISQGGSHEPANVRLAHALCNTARGNRGGGEQLALV